MQFLEKYNLSWKHIVVFAGLLLGVAIVMTLLQGLNPGLTPYGQFGGGMDTVSSMPYQSDGVSRDESYAYKNPSIRNVMPTMESMPPVTNGYATGNTSEDFEVKEYSAQIETRDLDRDCGVVRALKVRTDVIFESANEYHRGCSYTFKVEKTGQEEVLARIEELKPKELVEHSYTIKREVDDYTSEIQILENKLASLDTTLSDAVVSYDNITTLATNRGDVESLAKIIESKLMLIERLANARIETSNQLERTNRAKAEALDHLAYTYFTVNLYENTFVDGEAIKDSWKQSVQQFMREANTFVQEVSIGLVTFVLTILKFVLYALIVLFVFQLGWSYVRGTWRKMNKME